jgi:hypothetical protein
MTGGSIGEETFRDKMDRDESVILGGRKHILRPSRTIPVAILLVQTRDVYWELAHLPQIVCVLVVH